VVTDQAQDKWGGIVRPAKHSDQGYVCRTWVASVLDGPRVYFQRDAIDAVNQLVNRLLDDRATHVLVASPSEQQSDRIDGFIAYAELGRTKALLYLVVRNQIRKRGIATALVEKSGILDGDRLVYLFEGPSRDWLLKKHPRAVRVQPKEYFGG
jgi:hypothetical protein